MITYLTQLNQPSKLETGITEKTTSNKYHLPNINSELLKRNIIYQGPNIWNSLESNIKNKKSIYSFKRTLKNELLEKDL